MRPPTNVRHNLCPAGICTARINVISGRRIAAHVQFPAYHTHGKYRTRPICGRSQGHYSTTTAFSAQLVYTPSDARKHVDEHNHIRLSNVSETVWSGYIYFSSKPSLMVDGSCNAALAETNMLPEKRDRTNDYFRKAMTRLMRRCHRVSRAYDADIYILIRRRYRHYEYKSTDDPSFPPREGLVSIVLRYDQHIR